MNNTLWLPCTQMHYLADNPPLRIVQGEGVYLIDENGNKLIDAISSWWVNLHGHCHPYINKQIKQQLDTLEHTLLASVVHPSIETLADKLIALTPPHLTKAFFADSGSAAVEVALKMSLQSWHQSGQVQKNTFISLEHGYHGETLGSLAVTDIPLFSRQYAPLLINHLRAPSPADIFCPVQLTQTEWQQQCLDRLENLLIHYSNSVCAIIVEPLVQGAAGMAMYSLSYLQSVQQLANQYNVHVIFDEIAVGFGRTGKLFVCENTELQPDFVCLSKGLTAGYLPMSCVITTDSIYQCFIDKQFEKGFLHSHSFTGNPLAAAAALASLEVFEQQQVLANNQNLIQHLAAELTQLSQQSPISTLIKQPRQTGMIAAFTIDCPKMLTLHVHHYAKHQGVLLRPIGNHVYLMPPYCITSEEISRIFTVIIDAITWATNKPATTYLPKDGKLLA